MIKRFWSGFLPLLTVGLLCFTVVLKAQAQQPPEIIKYLLPSEERSWYVSPLLALDLVTLEAGAGLQYHDRNFLNRRYRLDLSTFHYAFPLFRGFTSPGYQEHALTLFNQSLLGTNCDLGLQFTYERVLRHYYGLGADTVAYVQDQDNHDEALYEFREGTSQFLLGTSLPADFRLELGYQLKQNYVGDTYHKELANAKQLDRLIGREGGPGNNLVARICYNIEQKQSDTRFAALKGDYQLRIAANELGADYNYNLHKAALTGLLKSPQDKIFLLSRAEYSLIEGKREHIPFYEYPYIGGIKSVRGLSDYRFRDTATVFFSHEVFYRVSDLWLSSVFFDCGQVFEAARFVNLSWYQLSWGASSSYSLFRLFQLSLTIAQAEGSRYPIFYSQAARAF